MSHSAAAQERDQRLEFRRHPGFIASAAFPDFEDAPPIPAQCSPVAPVAKYVGTPLFRPEAHIRRRDRLAVFAAVHVPEAAVDEQDSARPRENEVWFPGKRFAMQTVPQPQTVQIRAHAQFRLRVTAANARHVVAALFGCENVAQINIMSPRVHPVSR